MRHAGGLLLFHCNKCDVINYMMCVFILNAGVLQFVRNYIWNFYLHVKQLWRGLTSWFITTIFQMSIIISLNYTFVWRPIKWIMPEQCCMYIVQYAFLLTPVAGWYLWLLVKILTSKCLKGSNIWKHLQFWNCNL